MVKAITKKHEKPFIDDFYSTDGIVFFPYYKASHFETVSADTETKLYYKEKLLSEDEAYLLLKNNGQKWCKSNIEVKAYAFMLAYENEFACFSNALDFLTACAILNVKYVFWYNARFDFSIFDYYFLQNGWHEATLEIEKDKKHYRKLPDKTYTSLNGEFGQRYQMQIWKGYINNKNEYNVHKFKMLDTCNIIAGGLKKNLNDWKIKDKYGDDIRKLEMDYVNADVISDLPYMYNDTVGLYYLTETVSKTLNEITGFNLLNGEFMTAGGLAIKTLLKFMYNKTEFKYNKSEFKKEFPMSSVLDRQLREKHLYLGGKCLVNPYKRGVVQKTIYKYDVNSMYPAQMKNMLYPLGRGKLTDYIPNDDTIKVYCIYNVVGVLKPNKIGIFQDFSSGKYTETIYEAEEFLIWEEELKELQNWYDIDYELKYCISYKGKRNEGAIKFVDTFYDIKCNSKGAVKNGAKLELNSSYGKLSQKIERSSVVYEMSDEGYVHLVNKGTSVDTGSMLSVLVGSRITALARVSLMQYIRKICKENVKDNFIYCDTDSVHTLTEYEDTDAKELGKMKCEGVYKYAVYLAPKSYLMQGFDAHYEVHCKGVNTKVVENEIGKKSFYEACEIFTANRVFKCLCGINCKGGKALIYIDKVILNDTNYLCDRNCISENEIYYEIEG